MFELEDFTTQTCTPTMDGEEGLSHNFCAHGDEYEETVDLYKDYNFQDESLRRSPRKSPKKKSIPDKTPRWKWAGTTKDGKGFDDQLFREQFIYILRSIISNKVGLTTHGQVGTTWKVIVKHCKELKGLKDKQGKELSFQLLNDKTLTDKWNTLLVDAKAHYCPSLEGPRATGNPALGVLTEWDELFMDFLRFEKSSTESREADKALKLVGADIQQAALVAAADKDRDDDDVQLAQEDRDSEVIPDSDAGENEERGSANKKKGSGKKRKARSSPSEKNDMGSVTGKLFSAFSAQVVVKEKCLVFDMQRHEDAKKMDAEKLRL